MTNVLHKIASEIGPEVGAAAGFTAAVPDGSTVEQALGTVVVAAAAYLIRRLLEWLTAKRKAAQSEERP